MRSHAVQMVQATFYRNFVFGVEDGLVSTVGMLSGIASTALPQKDVVIAGTVLIFVEGFAMGVGTFLSESSAADYMKRKVTRRGTAIKYGIVMFISYLAAGFLILAPYLFLAKNVAFFGSIGLALVSLIALGITGARLAGISLVRNSVRMLILGGGAIALGIVVGRLVEGS